MSKHQIIHVELSSRDHEEAGQFYHELFGWEIRQIPEMSYATFSTGGVGGGFNPVSEGNPAGTVLIYISTDDIDRDLLRAEQLGGKAVQPKMEIPGVGWFALFSDPTVNRVALFTPNEM